MKSVYVEVLMGHSLGVSSSYMKPTEKELLDEYLKALPFLTISEVQQARNELKVGRGRNDDLSKKILQIESELVMIRSWIAQLPPYAVVPPSARQPLGAERLSGSGATP